MGRLLYILAIIVTLECTAYCYRGITASGEYVREGICAMDRVNGQVVPFGTKVILPNGRTLVVKDRFGANHNNHLDIWMASENDCWNFGRRWLKCRIEMP